MTDNYMLFPFAQVGAGSKTAVYGAGTVGYMYLRQIYAAAYCEVVLVVDKSYKEKSPIMGNDIQSPELLAKVEFDSVVIAARPEYEPEILNDLLKLYGVPKEKIIMPGRAAIPIEELFPNGLAPFHIQSYASDGQDFVVKNIFDALGVKNPSYIDAGAFHPQKYSNTSMLYRNGSRGINIEANPKLIEAFTEMRPNDVTINAGIGTMPGELPFYVFDDESAINSFVENEVIYRKNQDGRLSVKDIFTVPVITLQSVVDGYRGGAWPEYLDTDIEGMDYDVLKSCNFDSILQPSGGGQPQSFGNLY
jgi:FkbM family methyltransferase